MITIFTVQYIATFGLLKSSSLTCSIQTALYANCLAGNLVEQLWNFAWPVAIALLRPSLLPVAVIGFFSKVSTQVIT